MIQRVERFDQPLRDEMIDLWGVVTEAGGAVGFRPGATREEIAAGLAAHEASMDAGDGWLYVARADDGRLAGFVWWIRALSGGPHIATIKRLQVHPDFQGMGLGRLMMDHLHSPEVLGLLDGVDFLHLQYRVGDGLGGWYATYGYEGIARFDLWFKNPDGTYGGWAEMLRTRDGSPLPPETL